MSPESAYAELRPIIAELSRLITTAPLTASQRAGLGMLAIGHIFGSCSKDMQEAAPELMDAPLSVVAERFFALVTATLESDEAQEGRPN